MIEIAGNYPNTFEAETILKPTDNSKYQVWLFLLNNINLFIQLTATTYKELKVWEVKFEDGRQAVLYKCGLEWMQRNEDNLSTSLIENIGNRIDFLCFKQNLVHCQPAIPSKKND